MINMTMPDAVARNSSTPAARASSPDGNPIIVARGTAAKYPATAHKKGITSDKIPSMACLLFGVDIAAMVPVRKEKCCGFFTEKGEPCFEHPPAHFAHSSFITGKTEAESPSCTDTIITRLYIL